MKFGKQVIALIHDEHMEVKNEVIHRQCYCRINVCCTVESRGSSVWKRANVVQGTKPP